jgi:hypothetical protein
MSEAQQREAGVSRPVASMQLRSRHWRVFDQAGELVDEIQGDGVVGQQPILRAGGAKMFRVSVLGSCSAWPTVVNDCVARLRRAAGLLHAFHHDLG